MSAMEKYVYFALYLSCVCLPGGSCMEFCESSRQIILIYVKIDYSLPTVNYVSTEVGLVIPDSNSQRVRNTQMIDNARAAFRISFGKL